ncbi:MAG: choice-of-anchor Q domain-containing protein [Actinomycetota bacterium]
MRKDSATRRRTAGGIVLAISLIAALSVVLAPTAQAATITVTTTVDEYDNPGPGTGCSLREAITAANDDSTYGGCTAGSGDDDITLGASLYQLTTGGGGEDSGDLNVSENLTIAGAGANATTIQQTQSTSGTGGVIKADAANLTLSALTAMGGVEKEGVKADGGGDLRLDGVGIAGNTGGGVKVEDGGVLTVTDSTFSGNGDPADPKVGGVESEETDIRNSTFSGNTAKSGGGLSVSGSLTLNNVTITANTVDGPGGSAQGGGLHLDTTGTAAISNTIIAGNTNTGDNNPGPDDCSSEAGDISSGGYNLIGTGDGCNLTSVTGDQVGTDAALIDPQLNPLQNFGGTTETHLPLATSPAIEGGNPGPADGSEPNCEATDQRGTPRPVGVCDIGSVERTATDVDAGGGTQVGGALLGRCAKKTATVLGTGAKDVLKGTSGKDVMAGLNGRDKMSGKAKRDRMCGAGGKDTMRGGGGNDIIKGGKGNDLLVGGAGKDKCVGGPGRDRSRGCEKTVKIP